VHVEVKSNGWRLSRRDRDKLDLAVEHLDRLANTYGTRKLHVTIDRVGHSDDVQVRMVLGLSKRQLVATERAPGLTPATEQCVDVLAQRLRRVKDRVHTNHNERRLRRLKEESGNVDLAKARQAREKGDLEAFEDALEPLHEAIEAEVGRRLKFHPEIETRLGARLRIEDLVRGVIEDVFESFQAKPDNVAFRDWVLERVDGAIVKKATRRRRSA
jgi:ribosome-associated translation inhibitor RaiA